MSTPADLLKRIETWRGRVREMELLALELVAANARVRELEARIIEQDAALATFEHEVAAFSAEDDALRRDNDALAAKFIDLTAERDAATARANHALTPECLGTLGADGYIPNCRRFRAERDALRRDNDALRALLADLRETCSHAMSLGEKERIDAALAQGEKPNGGVPT